MIMVGLRRSAGAPNATAATTNNLSVIAVTSVACWTRQQARKTVASMSRITQLKAEASGPRQCHPIAAIYVAAKMLPNCPRHNCSSTAQPRATTTRTMLSFHPAS